MTGEVHDDTIDGSGLGRRTSECVVFRQRSIAGNRLDADRRGVGRPAVLQGQPQFGRAAVIAKQQIAGRFREEVELIKALWTQEKVTFRGRFYDLEDATMAPKPVQRPHPPIWMAAGSAPSIRKVAARDFNLMLDQYASPEQIGERMALYRAEREAHGRQFDPMGVSVARQLYVAADRADADAALARLAEYTRRTVSVSRSPAREGGSHVLAYADKRGATEEHALCGTPDEICSKLTALSDAGVEYVLLTVLGGKGQLRRFTQEVMPAFSAMQDGESAPG